MSLAPLGRGGIAYESNFDLARSLCSTRVALA